MPTERSEFIDDADNNGRWIPLPTARVVYGHPQVKGRRVYGQVGFNFAAHAGIAFNAGEWPLLTLTVPT